MLLSNYSQKCSDTDFPIPFPYQMKTTYVDNRQFDIDNREMKSMRRGYYVSVITSKLQCNYEIFFAIV